MCLTICILSKWYIYIHGIYIIIIIFLTKESPLVWLNPLTNLNVRGDFVPGIGILSSAMQHFQATSAQASIRERYILINFNYI
jgi:hypothetical protein